jgi:hypothetical protein
MPNIYEEITAREMYMQMQRTDHIIKSIILIFIIYYGLTYINFLNINEVF